MDKAEIVLSFLGVQVLERLIRIERFLDDAKKAEVLLGPDILNSFITELDCSVRKSIYNAFKYITNFGSGRTEIINQYIFNNFTIAMHNLDRLHNNLSYMLNIDSPQEIKIFIDDLFNMPFKAYIKKPFNVILSDVYMFEEIELSVFMGTMFGPKKAEKDFTSVLFLPKLESTNPLHWGTLVHEMCHAVPVFNDQSVPEKDLERFYTPKDSVANNVLHRWINEILCDLISCKILGPAYLASFVDFVVVRSSEGGIDSSSPTHPPARLRITLMESYLKKSKCIVQFTNPLFKVAQWSDLASFYLGCFHERFNLQVKYHPETPDNLQSLALDLQGIAKYIEGRFEKIEPLKGIQNDISSIDMRKLLKRLQQGIPIGAYSISSDGSIDRAEAILNKLDEGKFSNGSGVDEIKKDMEKVFDVIKERFCSIAAIINTGWLYKCENIYYEFIERLKSNGIKEYDDAEKEFKEKLFYLDDLLRNSIETAFIVKQFCGSEGNIEEIQG